MFVTCALGKFCPRAANGKNSDVYPSTNISSPQTWEREHWFLVAFGPFLGAEFRASIPRTPFCAILWCSPTFCFRWLYVAGVGGLPKRGFGPPLSYGTFHPPQVSVVCVSCTKIHDTADQKLFWRGPKIFGRARSLVRSPPPILGACPPVL